MRSAIAWWSRGLGGSEADVEDRGSRMLANLLQMPTAQFHQMYFLQKPLLVRVRALPLLGFVVVGLAVTVHHLLLFLFRLALIVICPRV